MSDFRPTTIASFVDNVSVQMQGSRPFAREIYKLILIVDAATVIFLCSVAASETCLAQRA